MEQTDPMALEGECRKCLLLVALAALQGGVTTAKCRLCLALARLFFSVIMVCIAAHRTRQSGATALPFRAPLWVDNMHAMEMPFLLPSHELLMSARDLLFVSFSLITVVES